MSDLVGVVRVHWCETHNEHVRWETATNCAAHPFERCSIVPAFVTRGVVEVCPNCEGTGTDGYDRNGSHAAGEYREYLFTGEMFGLRVHRPRLFELGGWFAMSPPQMARQLEPVAVYGRADGRRLWTREDGSELKAWSSLEEGREALEVPWMQTELEIREAIPPAYTRYLGEQFLSLVREGDG